MPNQRDPSKKLIGFFATPDEAEDLKRLAARLSLTVADLMRSLSSLRAEDLEPLIYPRKSAASASGRS